MSIRTENGDIRAIPRSRRTRISTTGAPCAGRKTRRKMIDEAAEKIRVLNLPNRLAISDPNRGPIAHPSAKAERETPIIPTEMPFSRKKIGTKLYRFMAVMLIRRTKAKKGKMEARIPLGG